MSFGFMANVTSVVGIGDFYDVTKPIKLVGPGSVDPYSRVMPQACYLSQLDLLAQVSSGSPECIKALLTWDAAGNDIMFRESESEMMVAGVTTAIKANAVIPIDTTLRAPSTQDAKGECYLWLKVNAGTVILNTARLHWAMKQGG